MRKNGTCYMCRKELPPIAITHGDPFCSNACAKGYYVPTEHGGS